MASVREQGLLTPILVTGMGRSGSTLAMQLLGTDEACVMDRLYPLESRYLSLIAQAAAQWDGRTFAEYGPPSAANQNILGSNPIILRKNADSNALINIPESSDMLHGMWNQFSTSVRTGAPKSKFYAEKVVEWIPAFIAPLLDCYTLFLFRDPRDLFLSTNSFNSKRGYLAFGRNEGDSDLDHATTLAYRFLHRYENFKALKRSGARVSLIRYEDMASNPVSTFKGVINATGIEIKNLPQEKTFEQHRTTASLEQSIERWKKEPLPAEILDIFRCTLGNILEELGYSDGMPRLEGKASVVVSEFIGAEQTKLDEEDVFEFRRDKTASTHESITIEFAATALDPQDVTEVWVCLSGGFGGRCTVDWDNQTQSQDYDIGPHIATLRFRLQQSNSKKVRVSIVHTGGISRSTTPLSLKIHRLEFITAKASHPQKVKTSMVNGFLNQFIRVNR